MDLATLAGLAIAVGSLIATVYLEGSHLSGLWSSSAVLLVVGGTIGATTIGARMGDLKKLPGMIASTFLHKEPNSRELIDSLVAMAEKARREGLLALQDDTANLNNILLVRGVMMIVDGTDPDIVRETIENQVTLTEQAKLKVAAILEQAGGYAPTIGIIGTVIGLVHVLGNLSNPEQLSTSIAVAFLATLWGIATANLLWLPLGAKLRENIEHEALVGRMCVAGVIGLQTGEAPRALREKLEVYVNAGERGRLRPPGGGDR